MKIDMFLVAGKNGNILADIGSDLSEGKNSSVPAIIREALRGKEPDISISWPSIKMINDQLYHIVSVPVYAGRNTIIGALMLGLKFTQLEVNEIKEENLFDVSFFHENKLVASSTDKADRKKLSVDFFKKHFESKTIEMGSTHCFTIIEESINSESLIAFISPMGKGERAYYMCFLSEETAINVANNLANYMYLLNSLLTIGIGFICFNKTSLDFFIKKQSKNDI